MAGSRKRKKKTAHRFNPKVFIAAAAAVVFIAAFIYFFVTGYSEAEREYAVYSSMDEPSFPVIYVISDSYVLNPMHAYVQDMGNEAAGDLITPLPDDRHLSLKIELYGHHITEIRYEIRSLNLEHYIENTKLSDFSEEEDGIYLELPIQNMIGKDTPYLLKITLDTGENTLNYYTRIIWLSDDEIYEMIGTAYEFTQKSFDYDAARDLTVYLENDDNADNSSYATVSLTSSFSQITWGSTGMKLSSTPIINIREYDGIMGAVEVNYFAERASDTGSTERYYVTDEYTMRIGSERIYMMDFRRSTEQIFEGNKYLFGGNRITLGITKAENIQTKFSDNKRFLAFKTGRDLWVYDQEEERAVNAFSFRSETDTVRASYDRHNIKILSLDDEGTMDFVVYGYMNRGRYEGYNGIVYYRYSAASRTTREIFFMPRATTYEKIALELDEMCTKAGEEMLYIKQADAVTAVDLTSLEMIAIVSDITDDDYAISNDQSLIAWSEGDGTSIRIMDVNTGNAKTITAAAGQKLRVLSFYGQHLIYGISGENDMWIVNGLDRSRPMHTIEIVDFELNEILRYEKNGLYFDDVTIENDRIQLAQYDRTGENSYRFAGRDTIVSSSVEEIQGLDGVTTDVTEVRKLIYYIDLDKTIKDTRSIKVSAPESVSIEGSGTLELSSGRSSGGTRYYAYQRGRLCGIGYSLAEAIDLIYDGMGWVTDADGALVYARADRQSTRVVSDPMRAAQPMLMVIENGQQPDLITQDGYIVMSAANVPVNRLMYYVSRGCPVMVRLDETDYCLLYGYTSSKVYIYHPSEAEGMSVREEMSLEDAAIYFDRYDNDFIVFRDYPGE